jgi:hypothetical protein
LKKMEEENRKISVESWERLQEIKKLEEAIRQLKRML